jgi:hypothetical protein
MLKYVNGFNYPDVASEVLQFVDQVGLTVQGITIKPVNTMIQAEVTYTKDEFEVCAWREGMDAMRRIGKFAPANILKEADNYDVVEIHEICGGQSVLLAVYHRSHGWISVGASRSLIALKHYISMD